jgi:hypothetical protein
MYIHIKGIQMPAKDKMFTLRLPSKLLDEYRLFCEENSINISKRIRRFMERDLEAWQQKKRALGQNQNNNTQK